MSRLLVLLGVCATAAVVAMSWLVPLAMGFHDDQKITVCHRTGSDKNPYHAITTDNSGTINAHLGNDDPTHGNVGPPHPPKDDGNRPDFFLPIPDGTNEDCKNADPDPK
jgi:hypothetical protein